MGLVIRGSISGTAEEPHVEQEGREGEKEGSGGEGRREAGEGNKLIKI